MANLSEAFGMDAEYLKDNLDFAWKELGDYVKDNPDDDKARALFGDKEAFKEFLDNATPSVYIDFYEFMEFECD